MVDFKNKLQHDRKIENSKESKVEEDIQMVSKIYSAVENTMKNFLHSFSRKRTNEENMEGRERAPKKKKEATFESDEDAERMEVVRVENGTNQITNGGNQIENGTNQIENGANLIENGAINQSQDEENIE